MAAESSKVYPETRLFKNGVTPERVHQVARVIPTLMNNMYGTKSGEIGRHEDLRDGVVTHVGMWLCKRSISLPFTPGIALTTESMLFIPESGGLSVCTTVQGEEPEHEDLGPDLLRHYDQQADYEEGSLSTLYNKYNSRIAAAALTYFARECNILEQLMPYAEMDPPQPDYAAGGRA